MEDSAHIIKFTKDSQTEYIESIVDDFEIDFEIAETRMTNQSYGAFSNFNIVSNIRLFIDIFGMNHIHGGHLRLGDIVEISYNSNNQSTFILFEYIDEPLFYEYKSKNRRMYKIEFCENQIRIYSQNNGVLELHEDLTSGCMANFRKREMSIKPLEIYKYIRSLFDDEIYIQKQRIDECEIIKLHFPIYS